MRSKFIEKSIRTVSLSAVCLASTAALALAEPYPAATSQAGSAMRGPVSDASTSGTDQKRAQSLQKGVELNALSENAPSSYTVKPTDTLWKIAGVFLKSPWRWPTLWEMNVAEVRNPHLIYPGEVLILDVHSGRARLSRRVADSQNVRLSPSIRSTDHRQLALSTIDFSSIAPFLVKPVMVEEQLYLNSAIVFSAKDNRLNVGTGGRLYAAGVPVDASVGDTFSLYRPGRAVKDPDDNNPKGPGALLGVEAVFLGQARLVAKGLADGLSTLDVTNASQEIGKGDRLVSIPRQTTFQYVPHAPDATINGKVVMMHDSRTGTTMLAGAQQGRSYETEGGPLSVVVINRGQADGLASGHVLTLSRPAKKVSERASLGFREGVQVAAPQTMPAEVYGSVMVFKTFSSIAYAIVMQASTSVMPGDNVAGANDQPKQ